MKKLLVCDLDNTLYDWVGYFVPSFYAMVDEAVSIMGCDREVLLDDFKCVHQLHHDSEHPFALLETATVGKQFPSKTRRELAAIFDSAFHAFNSKRKKTLHLYDGVKDALDSLNGKDIILVAHTEGKLYSVVDRMRRLDLLKYFSKIYCRERSVSPHVQSEIGARWLQDFPMSKVTELSSLQRKPSPGVLREICESEGVTFDESIYVGDSIARDVMMAKDVGVTAAWAKYGTHHSEEEYSALVRVTHWTNEDVMREADLKLRSAGIVPDLILETSFMEVLNYLIET